MAINASLYSKRIHHIETCWEARLVSVLPRWTKRKWADNFSWTLRRSNWFWRWYLMGSAGQWIRPSHIVTKVLTFGIDAQIICQDLFHPKSAMGELGGVEEMWSLSFSLCRTETLGGREARRRESGFVWSTRDWHREGSPCTLVSNDAYFRYGHELIRMLGQVVHVDKVIDTCHDVESQTLQNSGVALEYGFANIL